MDQEHLAGLTPGAQLLVQAAMAKFQPDKHRQMGAHHWLLALVERHGPMAQELTKGGVNPDALRPYLYRKLGDGDTGAVLSPQDVQREAAARAASRGRTDAAERDLAAVILVAAGYALADPPPKASVAPAASDQAPAVDTPAAGSVARTQVDGASAAYRPRSTRPTPTLEQYGRDLTREAGDGTLPSIVGRADEIQLVIETLCRRTKRNPVLVGPAGVGKTAIVEGLAQRVVRGDVPDVLKNVRVLALLPTLVVAGASVYGELQTRMKAVLAEAGQDGVILFIDEVHQVVGAGGAAGTGDIASLLKPALARGELACIAATTDDEYRRFIEPDAALERRFQPIRVQEPTPEQALVVLAAVRDDLSRLRGVAVGDDVLHQLVDFAGQYLRNRYFPDKAVDLLEQCVAHAITRGRSAVTGEDARTVTERMLGMPLDLAHRLDALHARMSAHALLDDDDLQALINRLQVTMRGMDVRRSRPNAVVLLNGDAAQSSEAVAQVLASELFGGPDREIVVDLSRFVHPADVTMLIGAPPGYVGYSDALPIHRLAQMPWCVLRLENIGICHPQVRAVLTQGLASGSITDARGRRLYLSDAVVVLTAGVPLESTRAPIGFHRPDEALDTRAVQDLAGALGEELAAQVDLVCSSALRSAAARQKWIEEHLLVEIGDRYRKQGLHLRWDETFVNWVTQRAQETTNQRDWERLMDETIGPLLVPHLTSAPAQKPRALLITCENGGVRIEPQTITEGAT